MDWTMPRPVLNWVAGIIAVLSLGSFALGIATADAPSRLPGERTNGPAGAALEAQEATPLGTERIEGPPPPPELTEEEKAKLEEEKKAREEAAALAKAEAAKTAGTGPTEAPPPPAPVEKAEPAPPPPPPPKKVEDPPF
jgi:hypothetical protein